MDLHGGASCAEQFKIWSCTVSREQDALLCAADAEDFQVVVLNVHSGQGAFRAETDTVVGGIDEHGVRVEHGIAGDNEPSRAGERLLGMQVAARSGVDDAQAQGVAVAGRHIDHEGAGHGVAGLADVAGIAQPQHCAGEGAGAGLTAQVIRTAGEALGGAVPEELGAGGGVTIGQTRAVEGGGDVEVGAGDGLGGEEILARGGAEDFQRGAGDGAGDAEGARERAVAGDGERAAGDGTDNVEGGFGRGGADAHAVGVGVDIEGARVEDGARREAGGGDDLQGAGRREILLCVDDVAGGGLDDAQAEEARGEVDDQRAGHGVAGLANVAGIGQTERGAGERAGADFRGGGAAGLIRAAGELLGGAVVQKLAGRTVTAGSQSCAAEGGSCVEVGSRNGARGEQVLAGGGAQDVQGGAGDGALDFQVGLRSGGADAHAVGGGIHEHGAGVEGRVASDAERGLHGGGALHHQRAARTQLRRGMQDGARDGVVDAQADGVGGAAGHVDRQRTGHGVAGFADVAGIAQAQHCAGEGAGAGHAGAAGLVGAAGEALGGAVPEELGAGGGVTIGQTRAAEGGGGVEVGAGDGLGGEEVLARGGAEDFQRGAGDAPGDDQRAGERTVAGNCQPGTGDRTEHVERGLGCKRANADAVQVCADRERVGVEVCAGAEACGVHDLQGAGRREVLLGVDDVAGGGLDDAQAQEAGCEVDDQRAGHGVAALLHVAGVTQPQHCAGEGAGAGLTAQVIRTAGEALGGAVPEELGAGGGVTIGQTRAVEGGGDVEVGAGDGLGGEEILARGGAEDFQRGAGDGAGDAERAGERAVAGDGERASGDGAGDVQRGLGSGGSDTHVTVGLDGQFDVRVGTGVDVERVGGGVVLDGALVAVLAHGDGAAGQVEIAPAECAGAQIVGIRGLGQQRGVHGKHVGLGAVQPGIEDVVVSEEQVRIVAGRRAAHGNGDAGRAIGLGGDVNTRAGCHVLVHEQCSATGVDVLLDFELGIRLVGADTHFADGVEDAVVAVDGPDAVAAAAAAGASIAGQLMQGAVAQAHEQAAGVVVVCGGLGREAGAVVAGDLGDADFIHLSGEVLVAGIVVRVEVTQHQVVVRQGPEVSRAVHGVDLGTVLVEVEVVAVAFQRHVHPLSGRERGGGVQGFDGSSGLLDLRLKLVAGVDDDAPLVIVVGVVADQPAARAGVGILVDPQIDGEVAGDVVVVIEVAVAV